MKRFRVLLLHALRLMLLLASRQVLTASASRVILQDSPSPSPSPSPDSESPSPDYSPELESPSPSPSPEYDPTAESPSPSPTPDSSPSPSPSSPNPAASPSPASASSSPSPSPEPMPSPAADSSCGTPPACSILLSGAVQLSGQTEAMLAVLLANYSYAPDDGSDWDTFARENSMPLGAVALQTISEQDTQAIVVDGGDKIYLAYRGTEETNIKDWITDLKFVPKEVPGLGNLHIGFVEAEDAAHAQVFDAITAMQAGSGKPIVTIGYCRMACRRERELCAPFPQPNSSMGHALAEVYTCRLLLSSMANSGPFLLQALAWWRSCNDHCCSPTAKPAWQRSRCVHLWLASCGGCCLGAGLRLAGTGRHYVQVHQLQGSGAPPAIS
ncbi:hypothetical protein ABPG77_010820 [Micractinium sp. CCAP 211/92]